VLALAWYFINDYLGNLSDFFGSQFHLRKKIFFSHPRRVTLRMITMAFICGFLNMAELSRKEGD
jgi:uncharacterized membrane protein YpjA